jgi:hypothetical protein
MNNRSPAPKLSATIQLYQEDFSFHLTQNGNRTGTNARIILYTGGALSNGDSSSLGSSLIRDVPLAARSFDPVQPPTDNSTGQATAQGPYVLGFPPSFIFNNFQPPAPITNGGTGAAVNTAALQPAGTPSRTASEPSVQDENTGSIPDNEPDPGEVPGSVDNTQPPSSDQTTGQGAASGGNEP